MITIPPKRLAKFPAISDLRKRAQRRLPLIAREYLEMGTGDEQAVSRNRQGLDGGDAIAAIF